MPDGRNLKKWMISVLFLALLVLAGGGKLRRAETAKDIFANIDALIIAKSLSGGVRISELTEEDYDNMIPEVRELILNSPGYVKDTLLDNMVWVMTDGTACCFWPDVEAFFHGRRFEHPDSLYRTFLVWPTRDGWRSSFF